MTVLGHIDTLVLGSALSRIHRIAVVHSPCQHPRPLRPLRVQLSQGESQERSGKALASPFGRGGTASAVTERARPCADFSILALSVSLCSTALPRGEPLASREGLYRTSKVFYRVKWRALSSGFAAAALVREARLTSEPQATRLKLYRYAKGSPFGGAGGAARRLRGLFSSFFKKHLQKRAGRGIIHLAAPLCRCTVLNDLPL